MSKSGKFGFNVEVNNVFRDSSQGLYGNRIPLDNPDVLSMFSQWNGLVKSNSGDATFSAIEAGGAQPQVDVVFGNKDYAETIRRVRAAAPDSPIRPLWRGANGFNLKPKHTEELGWILQQFAEDAADRHTPSKGQDLLRVKAFDSQGVIKEVESTVAMVADLRGKGHPVAVEVAIPYSNGENCDPARPDFNPYPDEFFVGKVLDAAKLAQKYKIPNDSFRVSLKDMVGELDGPTAGRLVGKIIDGLAKEKLDIKLGLHLHDAGLAKEAYVEAIAVAKAKNWPIAVDTVEGRDTGFVSTIELNTALKGRGINLGLTDEKIKTLETIGQAVDKVEDAYKVRRVSAGLTGEELRRFKLPGGGLASFEAAVTSMGLADTLKISQDDAVKVAGTALIAVGRVMGQAFAVTPGFQNKQIAALNLLKNMIEDKYLTPGMQPEDIKQRVVAPLTDEQVEKFFLRKMDNVVKEFLKGDMPAETHPVVRKALGRREGLLTDGIPSALGTTQKEIAELQQEGLIKPTPTLAAAAFNQLKLIPEGKTPDAAIGILREKGIIHNAPDGAAHPTWRNDAVAAVAKLQQDGHLAQANPEAVVNLLAEKTFQSAVSRATVLSEPLRGRVEKPWHAEPDASQFSSKEEYARSLGKFNKNLDTTPDAMENVRRQRGNLGTQRAGEATMVLLRKEQLEIEGSVLDYMSRNLDKVTAVSANLLRLAQGEQSNALKNPLISAIKDIHAEQKKTIDETLSKQGKQFLYTADERFDMAWNFFAAQAAGIAHREQPDVAAGRLSAVALPVIKEVKDIIDSTSIVSPMPGKIIAMHVSLEAGKPLAVKKGTPLFTVEAMKMQNIVRAPNDGTISEILGKKDMQVTAGQVLFKMVNAQEQAASQEGVASLEALPESLKGQVFGSIIDGWRDNKAALAANAQQAPNDAASSAQLSGSQLTALQKRGYNAHPLTAGKDAARGKDNFVHVVGNRAGCAVKIIGDLRQFGHDVRILHDEGDQTTPVVRNAEAHEKIKISKYTDQDEIIRTLRKVSDENPNKTVLFHPGWGFLSENDGFVRKMETEFPDGKVVFVGPSSKPMEIAGGKKTLRDLVQQVAPEFNPPYIGNDKKDSAADLQQYIDGDFSKISPIGIKYRKYFDHVTDKMGGDAVIKAIAGGGGRGISYFKSDATKSHEDNFRTYVSEVQKTVAVGENLFSNGEVLTEGCVRGNTHHIEVQFAASCGQSMNLGLRNCTAQNDGQKFAEINVIEGDYSPALVKQINETSLRISQKLAQDGYQGLGTLEMLVLPEEGRVCILEVNPRLQVEHGVTQEDIHLKTGKHISLPVLNAHLLTNAKKQSPAAIIQDLYGLTDKDIQSLDTLSAERVTHFRVNSKQIDLVKGVAIPTWVGDGMCPVEVSAEVTRNTGATILQGGLGKGLYDPQIGAILGSEKQAVAAAKQLLTAQRVSQVAERDYAANTNLATTLAIYPILFDEKGRVSRDFSTRTTDELLKGVKEGKVAFAAGEVTPSIWPGQKDVAEQALRRVIAETQAPVKSNVVSLPKHQAAVVQAQAGMGGAAR